VHSHTKRTKIQVFENRVLRIFGHKREEAAGDWRRLHNEGLRDFYASQSVIRVIKSRHVAHMES